MKKEHEISEHHFNKMVRSSLANLIVENNVLWKMLESVELAKRSGHKIKFFMNEGKIYFVTKEKKIGFNPE